MVINYAEEAVPLTVQFDSAHVRHRTDGLEDLNIYALMEASLSKRCYMCRSSAEHLVGLLYPMPSTHLESDPTAAKDREVY